MKFRDLEYAVSLAADGQFRRAAARCHVSQPTFSAQIAKLEDELGLQLFERGPRAATPTVNGRAVIRQAQVVLDEVAQLRALARAAQDPLAGPFHLGVIPTAGPYVMPRLLPTIRDRWPKLQLLLREEQTAQLTRTARTRYARPAAGEGRRLRWLARPGEWKRIGTREQSAVLTKQYLSPVIRHHEPTIVRDPENVGSLDANRRDRRESETEEQKYREVGNRRSGRP